MSAGSRSPAPGLQLLVAGELLQILRTYCDAVRKYSRLHSSGHLLVNGIDRVDGSPLAWHMPGGPRVTMSSITRQVHLLKTFALLSVLCEDSAYADHAEQIHRIYASVFMAGGTLPPWGGHLFIHPRTMQVDGPPDKGMVHELKDTFPDYDALYRVDKERTLAVIRSIWAAHAQEAGQLVVSRHAATDRSSDGFSFSDLSHAGPAMARAGQPSSRLTFMNASNDLMFAALKYCRYTGEADALRACEQLYARYVDSRHAATGLGAYMYTVPIQSELPTDDNDTMSWFGDRARRQLGPEWGEAALEMNLILERHATCIYGETTWMLLCARLELGPMLDRLCGEALAGLESFCRHGLVDGGARCRPMLSDGRDLSGFELARDGYYGPRGMRLARYATPPKIAATVMLAGLVCPSDVLRRTARQLFTGLGLGRMSLDPGEPPTIDRFTTCAEPHVALFLIEAFQLTGHLAYLRLAECVVDRMIRASWYPPFFQRGIGSRYASFDALQPLVVARLMAVAAGHSVDPAYTSSGSIYGKFERDDGRIVNVFDDRHFPSVAR